MGKVQKIDHNFKKIVKNLKNQEISLENDKIWEKFENTSGRKN